MIKVSVLLITYNHEKFIEEAIESILMQKTNFKFELIIGEDCSTDNTRNIVEKYKEKYPDKIVLSLQEKNGGTSRNIRASLKKCQGEYIALLEGDDYWIDENKLQKQVDFLDNNPDCTLCGHGYKRYYEETKEFFGDIEYENEKFSLEDFLKEDIANVQNRFHIRTLTRIFRKTALTESFVDLENVILWDYVLEVILLRSGNGAYLKEIMGVYRVNRNSRMQIDLDKTSEIMIEMRKEILKLVPPIYKHYVLESMSNKELKEKYYKFTSKFRSDSCNDKVIDYFMKNNFKKIVIYGAGILGRLLEEKLQTSDIEILYFVEGINRPDMGKDIFGLEQLNIAIDLDAIVVTPFFDFDNIKDELVNFKLNTKIISLEEVI